jgi:hypothetical protein
MEFGMPVSSDLFNNNPFPILKPECLSMPPMLQRQRAIGIIETGDDPYHLSSDKSFPESKSSWITLLTEICEHYAPCSSDHKHHILTDTAAIHTILAEMRGTMSSFRLIGDDEQIQRAETIIRILTDYIGPEYTASSRLRYATLTHILRLLEI